ncbi:MAG: DHA2 family efflux MFS transporter permease subunit [Rhodospirillaceae bacterium]
MAQMYEYFNAHPARRAALVAVISLAMIMQTLDATIANVALPHMQSSMNAAQDQISWVLTSYMIASVVGMSLTGFLAARFGAKTLFIASITGFTVASMLCGIAQSLPEMILFRIIQGLFGANLLPLSQSLMLDVFPREKQGPAMAIWGMGVMLGPILGPTLGGYLTEFYNWRWIFFINLPLGIICTLSVMALLPPTPPNRKAHFDFLGFGLLAIALSSFQLMLDRGETLDWFSSGEIVAELLLAVLCFYAFVVHMLTTDKPFITPSLFRDTNYVLSTIIGAFFGVTIFATMTLMPLMLQNLMSYSVIDTGYILMPRGIGTMFAMALVGRLMGKIDPRTIMFAGMAVIAASLWHMSTWTTQVSGTEMIVTGAVQGVGIGLLFPPLSIVAYSTLPAPLRTEGAAFFSLTRNMGASAGISIMVALLAQNTQINHAALAEHVTPFSRAIQSLLPTAGWSIDAAAGLAQLNGELTRQATMISFINDYRVMAYAVAAVLPLIFFLRLPQRGAQVPQPTAVADH